MSELIPSLHSIQTPLAPEGNIIRGEGYRITVLSPKLIRVEVQRENCFNDEATLSVWHRDLGAVPYRTEEKGRMLHITTEKVRFLFDRKRKRVIAAELEERYVPCNNKGNLMGTARTLDFSITVKLGVGILSKTGLAVIDDSKTLLFKNNKSEQRTAVGTDRYIFAYGKDFRGAIRDFFRLTGETPMLPRYVLGNWWSRYKAYSQEEYIALMERFERENLPFTVATIDMDWHYVKINELFGTNFKSKNPFQSPGWTGYSWNKELFPDYKAFLAWLKSHGYRVTVNLHPASGVRHFEDMYREMALSVGMNPLSKETVKFDLADEKFLNSYFKILHHPYERDGVDFWWMDWQQGKKSTVKGLDPLWALNHYHYLDSEKEGRRGMLLSRYAGIGSHRYPVGFSGDTIVYWRSLAFQPYFTETAANVGYGWWSHDIGGHTFGVHDDELYLRWCQLGVFSPIMRLHSTAHDLQGKEPWNYRSDIRRVTGEFLRLRHKLIPYLYTMNYLSWKEGRALCEPMYYTYPDKEEAYAARSQYTFGTELLVSPAVTKSDKRIGVSKTKVWLPEGRYTDIFNGRVYQGGRFVTVFSELDEFPVFARAGAIIPMAVSEGNQCGNPEVLEVLVYRGNNTFSLYEDDGLSTEYRLGHGVTTPITVAEEGDAVSLTIGAAEGDCSLVPALREYRIRFCDIERADAAVDGNAAEFSTVMTLLVKSGQSVTVQLKNVVATGNGEPLENMKTALSRYQKSNLAKIILYRGMGTITDPKEFLERVKASRFPKAVKEYVEFMGGLPREGGK